MEQWELARRANRMSDAEIVGRVHAAALRFAGTPLNIPETVASIPALTLPEYIPAALLLRMRQMIWQPPADAPWDKSIAKGKLLALVVAGIVGLPDPYNMDRAGQRMDDFLYHEGYKQRECYVHRHRLAVKAQREQDRRARGKQAAAGASSGTAEARQDLVMSEEPAALPPSRIEQLELEQYTVTLEHDGWLDDRVPRSEQRRGSGSTAASAASYECRDCVLGRPREAELRQSIDAMRARAEKAEEQTRKAKEALAKASSSSQKAKEAKQTLKAALAEAKAKLSAKELSSQKLQQNHERCSVLVPELRAEVRLASIAQTDAEKELANVAIDAQRAVKRLASLTDKHAKLSSELHAVQQELQARREAPGRAEAAAECSAAKARVAEVLAQAGEAQAKAAEEVKRRIAAEAKVKELSGNLTRAQKAADGAQRQLQALAGERDSREQRSSKSRRRSCGDSSEEEMTEEEEEDADDDEYIPPGGGWDDGGKGGSGDGGDDNEDDDDGRGSGGGRRGRHGRKQRPVGGGGDDDEDDDADDDGDGDIPIQWLWDGHGYTPQVLLACLGLKAMGVSDNVLQKAVEWVGTTVFRAKLPRWTNRKTGQQRPYFPTRRAIDGYDGVAAVLCDIRGVMTMVASARAASSRGGDAVMDNHVGLVSDGVTSQGRSYQDSLLRFGQFGQVTAGMASMVEDTGVAKAATIGAIYIQYQALAEKLRANGVSLPPQLAVGGSRRIEESDVEAVNMGHLSVSTTDRGAPEFKAVAEAEKLKAKALKLYLGRRLIRSRSPMLMRVKAVTSTSAFVDFAFVMPSILAHRLADESWKQPDPEVAALLKEQGMVPEVMALLLNPILASRPREPLPVLVRKLRAFANDPPSQPQAEPVDDQRFDEAISAYMLKHRLVMTIQEAMNHAVNAWSERIDSDGVGSVPSDFCLSSMAAYLQDWHSNGRQGPQYVLPPTHVTPPTHTFLLLTSYC